MASPYPNNQWKRMTTTVSKIRDEKGEITADTNEIQKTIRKHLRNLYFNKLENQNG